MYLQGTYWCGCCRVRTLTSLQRRGRVRAGYTSTEKGVTPAIELVREGLIYVAPAISASCVSCVRLTEEDDGKDELKVARPECLIHSLVGSNQCQEHVYRLQLDGNTRICLTAHHGWVCGRGE